MQQVPAHNPRLKTAMTITYPAYYKNHDASAFICLLTSEKYMEVRRLHVSNQLSFGKRPGIQQMCTETYLPATAEEFKKRFAAEAANMAEMFENINY